MTTISDEFLSGDEDQESLEEDLGSSVTAKCCECLTVFGSRDPFNQNSRALPIMQTDSGTTNLKAHGFFGQKTYKEVCQEISLKHNYGGLLAKE